MRIMVAFILTLSFLVGCTSVPDQAQVQQRKEVHPDRYIAKEFNHKRPYIYDDQNTMRHPDLDHRIAHEAERVYNVQSAVVLHQGKDIIIGLQTKADPWQPHHETVERVKERLQKKERMLDDYRLHFTNNQTLQRQMIRAKISAEKNKNPNQFSQPYEPHFSHILQEIHNVNDAVNHLK